MDLLKVVGLRAVPYSKSQRDDDSADRLSHRLTSALLVVFALLVSTKQFVGDPIHCWVPAHFKGDHEDYTNSYCWVRNTYYLPPDDYIPAEHEDHKRQELPYYQWVPMILLVQAMLFYLPYTIWTTLSSRSGIDVQSIVEAGQSFTVCDMTEIRDKTLQYMTKQMDRYLRCHNTEKEESSGCSVSLKHCLSRTCCRCCGRRHGNYLIVLYVIVKLLYLANVLGQLFLLDVFLGSSFHSYGFDVLTGTVDMNEDWPSMSSARFPRATMCDLKVRRLGNVHRYTVMCVLPINLFNEKIFLFIYFWMIFVAIYTFISLVIWVTRFLYKPGRRQYVKRHLDFVKKLSDSDRRKTAFKFVHEYLGQDGIFLLRLVAHNTNTITVTEFVASLWENYKNKPMVQKGAEEDIDV